jgi:ribosomal protein S18 acetylase RimI-like enzyme
VTTWQVRAAVPDDRGALQRIFREASLSNTGDRANLLAHPEALLLGDVDVAAGRTRVAVAPDGTPVGFSSVTPADDVLELDDLFVSPERMRQGVGRTLVDDLVVVARAAGFARIEVTANPQALDFYRNVGFLRNGDAATPFGPAPRMHRDLRPSRSAVSGSRDAGSG